MDENIQNSNIIEIQRGLETKSELESRCYSDYTNPNVRNIILYYLSYIAEIDKMTAVRIKLIDDIKMKILMDCGENINSIGGPKSIIFKSYKKTDPLYPARMNLENILDKDNYNIPFSILVGKEINKPSANGLGMKLWKSLNNYRKELTDKIASSYENHDFPGYKYYYFNDPSINNYKDLNDLNKQIDNAIDKSKVNIDDREALKMIYASLTKKERPNIDEPNSHWLSEQFGKSSVIASIGILSSLQNEILTARASAIEIISSRVGGGEYSFNRLFPLAYGPSSAPKGAEIEIQVMSSAYDSNQNPEVTCEGGQIIEIKNGKARIRARMPDFNGDLVLKGYITIKTKSGIPVKKQWETQIKSY
jgi:hypothetical protein